MTSVLNLTSGDARMGKLSSNLEKAGDEDVCVFDIPITGYGLSVAQIRTITGAQYGERSLQDKQGSRNVRALPNISRFVIADSYDGASVRFVLSGAVDHEFKDCKVRKLFVEVLDTGEVMLSFSVRVKPNLGKQSSQLLEYQNRPIRIAVSRGKLAIKETDRQKSLELGGDADADEDDDDGPNKRIRDMDDRTSAH